MNFAFDDETEAFRQYLKDFAKTQLAPHYQADDRNGAFHDGLQKQMAELGVFGLLIPEEYGGQGASYIASGVACEEIAYGDLNAGWLLTNALLLSDILVTNCNDEQKKRWLPPIASGEQIPAIALTEPGHGTDASALEMRAERDGNGWRLTGEKASISWGMNAEYALVFARTGGPGAKGISGFYVPLTAKEVSRSAYRDVGGKPIGRASIHFDGLFVPDEDLVGGEGRGFTSVMQGFDYSRGLIALLCIGSGQASIDEAFEYAKIRQAFGQPIGKFQGLSFPLVEYATYLRGARLLSYEVLWRRDNGLPLTTEGAMVKWWAPRLGVDAAHQALLTFGQLGYSEDFPHQQRMRDIMGMEIGDGTAQVSKLVVARQLLGRVAAP
jgi:cyclohexanecarboxyl-CoA dehydrogenase